MAKKPLPSPEALRQLLRYEPETGKLFWKERGREMFSHQMRWKQWNSRYAGVEAFCTVYGVKGYLQGCIGGKMFMSHRIVYAMHFGDPEDFDIDHINGVRTDNRLLNLRAINPAENAKNRGMHRNNTSGAVGVCWIEKLQRWVATIKVSGKHVHIGHYVEKSAAIEARKDAEVKYGFHENHGRQS